MSVIEFTAESAGQRKLPDGWRWVQLGKAARVFAGSAAPQGEDYFDPQGPPFVRVSDLGTKKRTTSLLDIRDKLSAKALSDFGLVKARAGTVVFPKSGAAIGTNNRAILGVDAYIVSHLMAVEPTDQIITDWLYWWLCQIDMMDYSDNTGYPSLKQSTVERIEILLPLVSEQKRLAAILNRQMAVVERARAAAEAQLEAAKALPAAYLCAVFNSSKAEQWPQKTIGDLRSLRVLFEHQDGNHGELHPRNKDFVSTGVRFVTAKHARRDGTLALLEAPYISSDQAKGLRVGFAKGGDVLLAHNATVGAVVLTPSDCEPFVVGTSLTIYRSDPNRMLPAFLFLALKSEGFQKQLADAMEQTTRNQVPITRQRQLSVPFPDIHEQQRIAAQLSEQIAAAEQTRKALEDQLDMINKVPAALLRRAFSGEL